MRYCHASLGSIPKYHMLSGARRYCVTEFEVLYRHLKWSPRIWGTVPEFVLKDWRRTRTPSVTTAGIPAEIRTWNLPIIFTALSSSATPYGSIDNLQLSILLSHQSVLQIVTPSFNKCMVGRTRSRLYSPIIRSHIANEIEFMLPVAKPYCSVWGLFKNDLYLWTRAHGAFFHSARQFFGLWRKFSDTCSQRYGHIRRHANWKLASEQIFIWTASTEP